KPRKEPEAGNRDRPLEGAAERREGAAEESRLSFIVEVARCEVRCRAAAAYFFSFLVRSLFDLDLSEDLSELLSLPPRSDFDSDLASELASDFPSDLASDFPSDLASELPSDFRSPEDEPFLP